MLSYGYCVKPECGWYHPEKCYFPGVFLLHLEKKEQKSGNRVQQQVESGNVRAEQVPMGAAKVATAAACDAAHAAASKNQSRGQSVHDEKAVKFILPTERMWSIGGVGRGVRGTLPRGLLRA